MIFRFLFLSLVFLSTPCYSEIVHQAHTDVELVAEVQSAQAGARFNAGVRFKMDKGWHIYWKNSGDSGTPPRIEWQLPDGVKAGEILWPVPEKIDAPPLRTYGYAGEVLLMVPISVDAGVSGLVNLKATVQWLACQVDCIPGKAEFSLTLPVAPTAERNPQTAPLFKATRKRLPIPTSNVEAKIDSDTLQLKIQPAPRSPVYFFAENPELVLHAGAQTLAGNILSVPLSRNRPEINRVRGVLVSDQAFEVDIPLHGSWPAARGSFLSALLFAFLGGIILNLMPCVLPVLSLKIFGFVKQAQENPRALFKHGLVFTAGVLVCFWIMAILLIALKAAGHQVGWGFQLQSPFFLIVLSILFFVLALNLFGFFEIGISLTTLESKIKRKGYAGSFSSGAIATLVATPCTAPFMGTALGFALFQPAWVSFLIFTALGLGMASPYLLLCANPAFIKFIPKPGPWMIRLKQFLGLLLLATMFWLLSILYFQFSPGTKTATAWETYSDERLESLLAEGRPVFIDFTAAWCLTCQVNKRIALRHPAVQQAFADRNIALLEADWTSYDEGITRTLARYGRNSIPLYVLYVPNNPEPRMLPEILTPTVVLKALDVIIIPSQTKENL